MKVTQTLLCVALTRHARFSCAQNFLDAYLDSRDLSTLSVLGEEALDSSDLSILSELREEANHEHRKLLPPCIDLPTFDPSADVETLVSFYVMGDTPYSLDQYYCLNEQLRGLNISDESALFTIHVGDIKRGPWACNYSSYNDIAKMYYHPNNALNYDPRDAFFVPGDNEWSDCNDPDEAWTLWTEHFGRNNRFGFGSFSPGRNITVERQTNVYRLPGVDRSENFAFFEKSILFIGLNIIGGDPFGDESVRLVQNLQWTTEKLAYYKNRGMKACVVFGHAVVQLSKGDRNIYFGDDFFKLLRTEYSELPVMYAHGDWHDYCIRNADRKNPNLWDLEVEDGGFAPPVLVSVLRNKDPNDDRYLFKVDQRGGLYSPLGECNKIYEMTWGEQAPDPADSTPGPTPMLFPTHSPTTAPTVAPTQLPTVTITTTPPTQSPTVATTTAPPTQSPTVSTTTAPPTQSPTVTTTTAPPTMTPTKQENIPSSTDPPTATPTQPSTQSPTPSPTGVPELFTYPRNGEPYPLGECQGDCDKNSHCQPGLQCFKRDGLTPVPGCSGSGRNNKDYCIVPPDNELEFVGKKKLNPEVFPLGNCKGYCYKDDHCQGDLKCFKRGDLTPVPGCTGSGRSGKNYCYDDTL